MSWQTAGYLQQWPHFLRKLICLWYIYFQEDLPNQPFQNLFFGSGRCSSKSIFRDWKWIHWGIPFQVLEIWENSWGLRKFPGVMCVCLSVVSRVIFNIKINTTFHRWLSMIICPSRVRTNWFSPQAKRRERFGHVSWRRLMPSFRVPISI